MTENVVIVFLGGLVIVILGAELVLRAASRLAAMLGVKPIIIGLTVVAIGTSFPELAVGIMAATEGRDALAVGNIAGTNVLNILFILGISAAVRALPLQLRSIRLDVPLMIGSAVMLIVMLLDGVLSRTDGMLLFSAGVVYVVGIVRYSRRESAAIRKEFAEEYGKDRVDAPRGLRPGVWNGFILVAGLGLTMLGADLLVTGAAGIARQLGVSEAFIGLTIVAIGTSAPELAMTIISTVRDDRDVAVGNLVGSSIFNILLILGVTCIVAPDGVRPSADVMWIDLPLAALVAIACYPVFRSDRMVSRREGLAFVTAYLGYLSILIFVRA